MAPEFRHHHAEILQPPCEQAPRSAYPSARVRRAFEFYPMTRPPAKWASALIRSRLGGPKKMEKTIKKLRICYAFLFFREDILPLAYFACVFAAVSNFRLRCLSKLASISSGREFKSITAALRGWPASHRTTRIRSCILSRI